MHIYGGVILISKLKIHFKFMAISSGKKIKEKYKLIERISVSDKDKIEAWRKYKK